MNYLLDLQNLNRYFGDFHALKSVSVQLPPGRIGLLGPNGAGKSTLLKILLGLLTPSSGTGTILGKDITTGDVNNRRLIGYMPEAHSLLPGVRGVDYVSLAGELYGMTCMEAQRRAHELLSALGLEEARHRKLEEYSTGMKQRLKLAQALVHDPEILFLDEPTSGLDPAGRDSMLRLLHQLGTDHGKSFVLSTHLLGDVDRICDQVMILHYGEVLVSGEVSSVRLKRQNRYRLQIRGNVSTFLEELILEDIQIVSDNGRGDLIVVAPESWVTRGFFTLAENSDVTIRQLVQDDEDLEEMFHRTLKEREANVS